MPGTRPLISADSHVIEPVELWDGLIPVTWWGGLPAEMRKHPGGSDPYARTAEMDVDGVSAEVLYPSLALRLFADEDPGHQAACFHRYNQWLVDYCGAAPDRLAGIGLLATYDIDVAVAEAQWCRANGLRGVEVWQTPPAHLPFTSSHYEPLWDACSALSLSVSLHILTGFDYSKEMFDSSNPYDAGHLLIKWNLNRRLLAAMDPLVDLVFSGVTDRHRDLTLVVVEAEVAWLPFFVDQLDFLYNRFHGVSSVHLERLPSEIFHDQIAATFFRDPHAAYVAERLGGHTIMWSSDFPHSNSTWPKSQEVVATRLGALPDDIVQRLVWNNASELFGLDVPVPARPGSPS
jgi:predicted TIM-barrel fold metal-dependent hydrolase